MPLFTRTDADAIVERVILRYAEFSRALGWAPAPDLQPAPFYCDLMLLIDVANGAYDRTEGKLQEVEQALGRVEAILLSTLLELPAALSEAFWQSPPGVLVSRTRWWLWADDLITISNAAALAFGENSQTNRMRIARAIDAGLLDWVPDPSVANPQQNRRVRRVQVERLRDMRRLPVAE